MESKLTPIADWLDVFEEVTLPSGKVVGLRQVDMLSVLTSDGQVPNILMPLVQSFMDGGAGGPQEISLTAEDTLELSAKLNQLTRACFAFPKIVDTPEEEARGEGIQLHRVSMIDKIALLTWSMGGQAALDAGKTAFAEQTANLATVQSGNGVRAGSKRHPGRKKPVAGGTD